MSDGGEANDLIDSAEGKIDIVEDVVAAMRRDDGSNHLCAETGRV